MHRLYRLQQRLALTTPEASALLFVAAVLLTGFGARHFQAQATAFDGDHYAALHEDFAARSPAAPDSLVADTTAANAASAPTVSPAPRSRRSTKASPVRMNLNTASVRLLQRLPRIGPKMAERIVAYREAHGPFAEPSHVVRVRGIGPKTYEKLAPYLFVEETEMVAQAGGE